MSRKYYKYSFAVMRRRCSSKWPFSPVWSSKQQRRTAPAFPSSATTRREALMHENSKRSVTVRLRQGGARRGCSSMSQDSGDSITDAGAQPGRARAQERHAYRAARADAGTHRRVATGGADAQPRTADAAPTSGWHRAADLQRRCQRGQRYALDFARHYDLFSRRATASGSCRRSSSMCSSTRCSPTATAARWPTSSMPIARMRAAKASSVSGHGRAGHRRDRCRRTRTAAATAGSRAGLRPAARAAKQHTPKRVRKGASPTFLRHPLQVQPHAIRTATVLPATRSGRGCDAGHRTPSKPSQRRFQPWLRRAAVPQPQHGPGTHLLYRAAVLCSGCSSSSPASSCCTANARSAQRSPISGRRFSLMSSAVTSANGRCGPAAAGRNGHPRRSSPSPGSRMSPARSAQSLLWSLAARHRGDGAARHRRAPGDQELRPAHADRQVPARGGQGQRRGAGPAGAQKAPGDAACASARCRCRRAASASTWPSSAAPAPARPRRSWACSMPSVRAATRP